MINTNMWLDGDPSNQPPNTCRENYNINNYNNITGVTNELSNGIYSSYAGDCIGIIALNNNEFCIFSKDNRIGLLNSEGVYTNKLTNSLLAFDNDSEVQGDYYINDKGNRIIVFTYNKGLRIFNIDVPNLSDFDLINKAVEPTVTSSINLGGNLEIGAYYIICRYIKEDQSTTNYFKVYKPLVIQEDGKKSGELSNKGIAISLTNLDTSYKYIEVGFVQSKESVRQGFLTNKIRISGTTANLFISGGEILLPIDLNEVVENKAIYKNINYIKFVKNTLMGLGVKEFKEPNHQALVNNLTLNWYSELLGEPSPLFPDLRISTADFSSVNTFMHGEVYAFYIRFKYTWGRGDWYSLIGRASSGTDNNNVTINNKVYKKYETEDTVTLIGNHLTGKKGTFGCWINKNEDYPLEGNFPTGKVRHFKFPSINWMRNTIYTNADYGTISFDRLGVIVNGLNLVDFKDSSDNIPFGYEIGYAKRTAYNSTVLGQSIVVVNQFTNTSGSLPNIYTGEKKYSNGGNFFTDAATYESRKSHRVYPLEMLRNLGGIKISSFREEYKISTNVSFAGDYVATNDVNNPLDNEYNYGHLHTNYTLGHSAELQPNFKNDIADSFLVLNNSIKNDINNTYSETFVNLEYNTDLESLVVSGQSSAVTHKKLKVNNPITPTNEITKLVTLLNTISDCYIGFSNQKVISLYQENGIFFGGDAYINKLSIVLYGTYAECYRKSVEISAENDEQGVKEGNVFIKTYLCESVYNANSLIDSEVKHFPNFDFTSTKLYHVNRSRDLDPNLFNLSINKDYSTENDLEFSKVFLNDNINFEDTDYKIVRSGNYTNNKFFNIREFSRDDYYLVSRNKGKPISLEEDRDFIYIQTDSTLFKSATSQRAVTDSTDNLLYVKVGDIFDYPLLEVQHTGLGEFGSRYRHACKLTKWGYVLIDQDKYKVVLVTNSGIKVLSDEGLINTFRSLLSQDLGINPFTEKSAYCEVDEKFERLFVSIGETTLIYSFVSGGWSCFTTYKPKYLFRSRTGFYSLYQNKIYKHNLETGYNNIYGVKITGSLKNVFPTRTKEQATFSVNGISFKTSLLELIRIFNSYQDTGYLNLKPIESDISIKENSGNIRKFKGNWLFYQLRDWKTTDRLNDSYIIVESVLTSEDKQSITELEILI